MTDLVLTELDRGVLIVRINRIEKKNALVPEMYEVLKESIDRGESDRDVRVILFTGSGGVFTAGNDVADFAHNPPVGEQAPVNRFIEALLTTDVPLVAAVDGFAVGVGTTMLLHFDRVFATAQARFSMPFINLGVVPEAASSMLLTEYCGYQKAAELLMLGEPFDGEQALRYGIVSELCESDVVLDRALAWSQKLATKPRDALRATKRLMRRPKEPLVDRSRLEMRTFSEALASPAAQEAITAFLEKRAPDLERFN